MIWWNCQKKNCYKGSIISFYDYENGKVYKPFQKQRNVLYGKPVYLKNYFWFLQGDYNVGEVTLFRYLPDEIPEMITKLNIEDIDTYNLRIIGEDIHIISEDDEVISYYPKKFKFCRDPHESIQMIVEDKVYLLAWVEEGWDEENNLATEDYKYYHKVVVRDFEGNVLSEELGSLDQGPDGIWWIS